MIHPTADVSPTAIVGSNTRIWHGAQICGDACVGDECIIGSQVYIDRGVSIGKRVKIQTGAQIYRGALVDDGVFIGPRVCLTNDAHARAVMPDGRLKTDADWKQGWIHVRYGASLGAGAILLPGIVIGRFAMVGAGAVVTKSVPDFGLVIGVPASMVGYVCACGHPLRVHNTTGSRRLDCLDCGAIYRRRNDGCVVLAKSQGSARTAADQTFPEGDPQLDRQPFILP